MNYLISKAFQRQTTACISILLASFLYGCQLGWLEATTPIFLAPNSPFNVTTQDMAWIGSASLCGTIVNVPIFLLFTKHIGRKKSIIGGIIIYCIMWLILTLTRSTDMIKFCLFSIGVTSSFLKTMNNVYIGEIATPKNREILSIMYNILFGMGKGLIFALSLLDNYAILSLVPFTVSITAIIFSFCIRESPCYLISQNLNDLGRSTLCWLRNENSYELVKQEFEDMQKYVENQTKSGLLSIFKEAKTVQLFLLYLVIFGIGFINCNSVILVYGPEFVKNLKTINGNVFMNTYSAIQIIYFVLSYFTVKKLSRRDLLLYGFTMTFIIHVLGGLCFFIEERSSESINAIEMAIAVLLIIYMIIQILTISAGIEVLRTEIYSFRVKEICGFLTTSIGDLILLFLLQIYFPVREAFGDSANFVVYSLFSICGVICIYFFMRDTKNKTLLQIQIEHNSYGLFVRGA